MAAEPLSPEWRAGIRARVEASNATPGPCPVCGTDRRIGSRDYRETKWACYAQHPGQKGWDIEHYTASIVVQRHVDPDIVLLLDALEAAEQERDALREAAQALEPFGRAAHRYAAAHHALSEFLARESGRPVREVYGITEATTLDEALVIAAGHSERRNALKRERERSLCALMEAWRLLGWQPANEHDAPSAELRA